MTTRIKSLTQAHILKALQTRLPCLHNSNRYIYPYHLTTTLGLLWVSPCDGAIRTCFEIVPSRAPAGTHLNPYSGKWNFEGLDTEIGLEHAINHIERITS